MRPFTLVPLAAQVFLQANGYDRIWGAVLVGFHVNQVTDVGGQSTWSNALGIGGEAGVDLLKLGPHRLGIYGRIESELISDVSYAGFIAGLAYRL